MLLLGLFRVLFLLLDLVSQFPHLVVLLSLLIELKVIQNGGLWVKLHIYLDHVGCLRVWYFLGIS